MKTLKDRESCEFTQHRRKTKSTTVHSGVYLVMQQLYLCSVLFSVEKPDTFHHQTDLEISLLL